MAAKKQAHLLGFIQHGVNSHATGMWRHSKDKVNWDWSRLSYWQHMAQTMERGLFDAMFIADELAPYNNYEQSSDACVKWAVQCPTHEPSTIVPIITTATKHLGVGVTLSTAFEHPYSMVRRLSSLDHLSSGRIAWNIVSSYSKSEWDAYGATMSDRSRRYEHMEEYMEICYQLWDTCEPTPASSAPGCEWNNRGDRADCDAPTSRKLLGAAPDAHKTFASTLCEWLVKTLVFHE